MMYILVLLVMITAIDMEPARKEDVFVINIQKVFALNIQTHWISASNGAIIRGSRVIESWQQNERQYRP